MKRLSANIDYERILCSNDPIEFVDWVYRTAPIRRIADRIVTAELIDHVRFEAMNFRRVRPSHKERIDAHFRTWSVCTACPLGSSRDAGRHVFFRGYVPCEILFIGEAPGETEDCLGMPFTGRCGRELNKIISRVEKDCYGGEDGGFKFCVTNSVICTPYTPIGITRPPTKKEYSTCAERLREFIQIVEPTAIVTVGKVAESAYNLLANELKIPSAYVLHPGSILRMPSEDQPLEIDRATLTVEALFEKYVVPF